MPQQVPPLKLMHVTPLAAESFGVRSMCTLVQTPDVTILLDPGISVCPWRFNLPPHPLELQNIQMLRKKIANAADKAEIATISHYHYDHYTPYFEDWIVNWTNQTETARQIYQNKTLLIKNTKTDINKSQQERAKTFLKTSIAHAKAIEEADKKTFTYNNTKLHFSQAVPHGEDNTALGHVIMLTVEYQNERFMFAPDIQGPMSDQTQKLILEKPLSLLMLGGPPFYLQDIRVNTATLQKAVNNLKDIVKTVPFTILEHHTLRDEFSQQKINPIKEQAKQAEHNLLTAAEFVNEENHFLEANRKKLYKTFLPSKEFQQWIKTLNNSNIKKPPI
ncbi:MAG: MBL fold metallo-hydrolase [Candidatus Bathyarchaeota archaeon]|nr:MBL fold metallo-hydrolase [Candidatus Termiticorpusculum sp.]